jgi:hypothetical protein
MQRGPMYPSPSLPSANIMQSYVTIIHVLA